MKRRRFEVTLLTLCLTLSLSGCGFVDGIIHGLGIIWFVVGLIWSIWLVISVVNTSIRSRRGTNVVTRFVRNGMASSKMQRNMISAFVAILVMAIGIFLLHNFWYLFGLLVPIAAIVLQFVFMYKDTHHNKQRVKDSRVMTKASLDATAQAATVAGAAIGSAVPGIGTMAGQAIGSAVSGVAANASQNMQVEGAVQVNMAPVLDSATFLLQAKGIGIPTDGRSIQDVAAEVIKYADPRQLARIDQSQPIEIQAQTLLGSYKELPVEQ